MRRRPPRSTRTDTLLPSTTRFRSQFTQVRAPIDGRIGRAMVTEGNLAQADQTLLTTLVSQDPMYVYFESDEQTYLRYAELARQGKRTRRSEEHTSELQSLMRISYAVFCLKKKKNNTKNTTTITKKEKTPQRETNTRDEYYNNEKVISRNC